MQKKKGYEEKQETQCQMVWDSFVNGHQLKSKTSSFLFLSFSKRKNSQLFETNQIKISINRTTSNQINIVLVLYINRKSFDLSLAYLYELFYL